MTTTIPGLIEEMSARLTALKEDSGLSYKLIERAVVDLLGDDAPTHETIRAYHDGRIRADRVNDRLVAALCRVYNRPVMEIAPFVADRIAVLRRLTDEDEQHSRCTWFVAGQRNLNEYQLEQAVEEVFVSLPLAS